ncbi:MAG TPA: discoidin domain-containing protein, partial [Casimicrobiaceae bacterium]|nr:discoidin domain-containing protein [Casimicrobiaceae bacterium]
ASSAAAGATPAQALDGVAATAWRSEPTTGPEQHFVVDYGFAREFGGLVLRWRDGRSASRYEVQFSDDGVRWRTVRRVEGATGGTDAIALPESETRYLRLALHDGPARGYALAELETKELAFGASPNAFFQTLAREAPRGHYPRGISGEQPSWTIVGVDGGSETALLSEDGALEVARGGFSIEPFIVADSKVVTWADVDSEPFLVDDDLPMPGVLWRRPQWELRVTTFGAGDRGASRLVARYDVRNPTDRPLTLTLVLAIRPFQVNPPAQFLNAPGGVSRIETIAWDGDAFTVNGNRKVIALTPPDRAGAFPYAAGPPPRLLTTSEGSGAQDVQDGAGYASGMLAYRMTLAPRATYTVGIVVPWTGPAVLPAAAGADAATWLAREERAVAAAWRDKLDRVAIRVPLDGRPIVDAMRTSLAHILITRDGPILRPGTRSYARSWIRDGAMMSEALLRTDHASVAADYLRWYAPHQFRSGKVPCCVDPRGADPVPENDSAGELLFLAATIYRYTNDRALLASQWPRLAAAARYLEELRQSERTDINQAPARRAFYGMMPASISHEGYSEKPMHSYWDNFWALKGYDAAVDIATALNKPGAVREFGRGRNEFRRDLVVSLREAMTRNRIAFIPGSAELGDFDPTSTTIAFAPAGTPTLLPKTAVAATYERYWKEFLERRDGRREWEDYTPYELRIVGTFVRLGWRERAHELLEFFLAGRRPVAWNQWPEVVGRDARRPRFVGDMPHGWVASDYVSAVLDLFAYERELDNALVVAGGVPASWLRGTGIEVKGLQTQYGALGYSMQQEGKRVIARIDAGLRLPPGGIALVWPGTTAPGSTTVNDKPAQWDGNELRIRELPASIVIDAR